MYLLITSICKISPPYLAELKDNPLRHDEHLFWGNPEDH
jgi:hypothetical protein